jgi:hypothetical protein
MGSLGGFACIPKASRGPEPDPKPVPLDGCNPCPPSKAMEDLRKLGQVGKGLMGW